MGVYTPNQTYHAIVVGNSDSQLFTPSEGFSKRLEMTLALCIKQMASIA
jgi:hypothetical protein